MRITVRRRVTVRVRAGSSARALRKVEHGVRVRVNLGGVVGASLEEGVVVVDVLRLEHWVMAPSHEEARAAPGHLHARGGHTEIVRRS